MIICPSKFHFPSKIENITDELIQQCIDHLLTNEFHTQFQNICLMDSIAEVSLGQMKIIKGEFMEKILRPEILEQLNNPSRLLVSWIDGALEYTILKHEVIVLRLKNNKVLQKIQQISQIWPKKKEFIEGAYKIFLFTKN